MPAGLFGKLPSKRDFVAVDAPRRFLEVWEGWLQAGVATSRQTLGSRWIEVYNRAPIWRCWLGAEFSGEATIGAFMASVDGVGRSFPLTLFFGEGPMSLPPPELDPNDAWCEAAEAVLLGALAPGTTLEAIAAAIADLPPPSMQERAAEASGIEELPEGAMLVSGMDRELGLAFRAARRFGHRRAFGAHSFWWTVGGEGFPPLALSVSGLPLATRFSDMLTGEFHGGAVEVRADGG
jgi:type VI secretion system protein ImpM